jgi:hypothetical protein
MYIKRISLKIITALLVSLTMLEYSVFKWLYFLEIGRSECYTKSLGCYG